MHIVWTTLPTRYENGALHLSVYVSPRIDGGTLQGTPFLDWPAMLAQGSFAVSMAGFVMPATVLNAPFDSTLWTTLFGPNSLVQPFPFQSNSGRPLWSYPVDTLMSEVDKIYTQVAQSSPTAKPLVGVGGALDDAIDKLHQANIKRLGWKRQYDMARAGQKTFASVSFAEQAALAADPSLTPLQRAAYLARRFYSRPSTVARKDAKGNAVAHAKIQAPVMDFHKKVAMLGEHPFIMRKLGLVIDLAFAWSARALMPAEGDVFVVPSVPHGIADATPKTRYQVKGNLFLPKTQGGNDATSDMMLPLDQTATFAVVQGEPDGDAHKITNYASTIAMMFVQLDNERKMANGPAVGPQEEAIPARRTSGFVVTRRNRSTYLATRFTRSDQLHPKLSDPPQAQLETLWADDVIRGYRVDVKDDVTGAWKSLQERIVTYTYGQANGAETIAENVPGEGWVTAAAATSDPDPNVRDMYVHEALFGWEGWSLAVPRPGRRVHNADGTQAAEMVEMADTPPPPDFPFKAWPKVRKGTLLQLRFGRSYTFRVRLVDLAGNSITPADVGGALHDSPPQVYRRTEPIPPPTFVLKDVVTEGESVEHLVIRSNGQDSPDVMASKLNSSFPDPVFKGKYKADSQRHVGLPKATQILCEQHSMFDGAFVDNADRKAWFRLATREEGTFADKRIVRLDVDDAYIDNNPNGAAIITPPSVPRDKLRPKDGGPDVSSLTERRGDPLAPGEYVICNADKVMLPYLPDPAAGGAAFWIAGSAADFFAVDATGAWPGLDCFRLRLAGGIGTSPQTDWDSIARIQTVKLPPAHMLRLRYASRIHPNFKTHFGYWLDHSQDPSVLAGRHWMITPWREVVLAHAVQKPLGPPKGLLKESRGYDDTFLTVNGVFTAEGRSTGLVDLIGTWNEYSDIPSRDYPNDIPNDPLRGTEVQTGDAFQVPIAYPDVTGPNGQVSVGIPTDSKHEFGDTKHRKVTYTTRATTRYREYFPAAMAADTAQMSLDGTAIGSGQTPLISVPSSARPQPPRVAYIVPTFKWEISADGKTSTRHGNGLRLYLERPWYSSGEGEKLAILLYRYGVTFAGPSEPLLEHCSRWGRDPMWNAKGNGPLLAAAFKNGTLVQGPQGYSTGLLLSGNVGRVDAMVYDVGYDAGRKLWVCDVELDGKTYFPFIRFSLARYQSESLGDVELSPDVLVEFAQLVSDRTATFTVGKNDIAVNVTGPVAENAAAPLLPKIQSLPTRKGVAAQAAPRSHRLVAYYQVRQAGAADEMGWSDTGGETTLAGYQDPTTGVGVYSGKANIPTTPAGAEVRLVVEEREYFMVDPKALASVQPTAVALDYRVVYVDTFKVK